MILYYIILYHIILQYIILHMWPFFGYTPVSDAPTHTEISSCDEDAPNAGLKHFGDGERGNSAP